MISKQARDEDKTHDGFGTKSRLSDMINNNPIYGINNKKKVLKDKDDPLSKTTHNFNFKKAKPAGKHIKTPSNGEDPHEMTFMKRKVSRISTKTGLSPSNGNII